MTCMSQHVFCFDTSKSALHMLETRYFLPLSRKLNSKTEEKIQKVSKFGQGLRITFFPMNTRETIETV